MKTELRSMFSPAAPTAGGRRSAATSAPSSAPAPTLGTRAPAARLPQITVVEAASRLADVAGGGLACQVADAGLGVEWGREVHPQLTYVLLVEKASAIREQVGGFLCT
jgi:hypothetical protein